MKEASKSMQVRSSSAALLATKYARTRSISNNTVRAMQSDGQAEFSYSSGLRRRKHHTLSWRARPRTPGMPKQRCEG